jgi:hypothetical protein
MRIHALVAIFVSGLTVAGGALWTPPASAETYYVRTSGSDSNDGRASSRAFATIQKAAQVANTGDTVYVGGRTYTGSVVFANFGTSSLPIR